MAEAQRRPGNKASMVPRVVIQVLLMQEVFLVLTSSWTVSFLCLYTRFTTVLRTEWTGERCQVQAERMKGTSK
jgi:hypothetical protein